MRIAVWNLDHGRFDPIVVRAQRRLLAGLRADVVVLTEVPVEMSQPDSRLVLSPVERPAGDALEAWVGIDVHGGKLALPQLPLRRMAVAARATVADEPTLVYGSVLPWRSALTQAKYLVSPGDTALSLFARVLDDQVADIRKLRAETPDHLLIWAGDFNQPLSGTNAGFDNQQRALLADRLDHLGMVALNQHMAHANGGHHAIDFICVPSSRPALSISRFEPTVDGLSLSDHAGYVVDI